MIKRSTVADRKADDQIRRAIESRIGLGKGQWVRRDLYTRLGWSYEKYRKRIDNPSLFTLDDLRAICSLLDIPAEEIRPHTL